MVYRASVLGLRPLRNLLLVYSFFLLGYQLLRKTSCFACSSRWVYFNSAMHLAKFTLILHSLNLDFLHVYAVRP